jgi:hypothetical protein
MFKTHINFSPDGVDGGGAPPVDTGQNASPPQTPSPPSNGWFGKLDPELKTWAESKGWKDDASADPVAIAQSYHNLEKLFGADKAGRTLQLPKDADDKAALDVIYDKLGRPKDANEYQIELPEGADATFANMAKEWFHKAGLTVDQAKAVTQNYKAMELDNAQNLEVQHAREVEGLQREWGARYDQSVQVAKSATAAAGLTEEHIKLVEGAIGPNAAVKMFEFFGRNYTEAGPPGSEQRTNQGFSGQTPGGAVQRMAQLRADPNFMSRYGNSDPGIRAAAMQEMDNLAKLAVNVKA